MPKVKKLAEEDPRATSVRKEIGSVMGALRMTQKDLARKLGIAPSTLTYRLSKDGIGSMRLSELWAIQDMMKGSGHG